MNLHTNADGNFFPRMVTSNT